MTYFQIETADIRVFEAAPPPPCGGGRGREECNPRRDPRMTVEQAAKIFHEWLRSYRAAVGDRMLPPWEETTEHGRETGRDFVRLIIRKPDIDPRTHHDDWTYWKIRRGWTWGPEYSEEKRINPCLVSYADLPPHKRAECDVMVGMVKAMLPVIIAPADLEEGP